jgi:hypothetical protein
MKRQTKKEKIQEVEAKLAALYAEYAACTDEEFKFTLLRLETGLHRELQSLAR